MADMKSAVQYKIADPGDWCTQAWAAEKIGVSLRHVRRLVAGGKLRSYTPRTASRESRGLRLLLDTAEVQRYAAARKIINPDG